MPQSREEKLRKKREAERRRYEKLKHDPEGKEKLKQKERNQYLKKKEKKVVQPINELSKRDQRMKRKQWRHTSAAYRLRRKQNREENEFLEENTPPPSPISLENAPRENTPQSISGKRLAAKNRKIRSRRSKEKNELIEKLKKQVLKYKVKYHRLKKLTKNGSNKHCDLKISTQFSPKTRVNELMRDNSNTNIAKKLLFGEVMKDQLKTNYIELKCDKEKRNFRHALSGQIVKKYKLTNDLRAIVRGTKLNETSKAIGKQRAMDRCKKINAIWTFLTSDMNSRMCPGKKDYCSKKGNIKQKRYLNDTMANLHKKFLKHHPTMPVSYAFWCKNRPFYVVSRKVSARDTCGCIVCINMSLLIHSLSRIKVISQNDPSSVISSFCCENKTETCFLRECSACKYKKIFYQDYDPSLQTYYLKWCSHKETYFDKKTRKEKVISKVTKQKFFNSAAGIVKDFENNIIKYLMHRGRAWHQYKRISELKDTLMNNEALIHMDFSENYSLKYAEEIQSFHFGGSRKQISLHTVVVYTRSSDELKKRMFLYLI